MMCCTRAVYQDYIGWFCPIHGDWDELGSAEERGWGELSDEDDATENGSNR